MRARGSRSEIPAELKDRLNIPSAVWLRVQHVLMGTATPIQTDVEDMWDLLNILGMGAEHVIGDAWSDWRSTDKSVPVITGKQKVTSEREAWPLFRNRLPAAAENEVIFGFV